MSEQRGKAAGTAEVLLALAQRFDTMMPSWTLIIAASPEQCMKCPSSWPQYRLDFRRIRPSSSAEDSQRLDKLQKRFLR